MTRLAKLAVPCLSLALLGCPGGGDTPAPSGGEAAPTANPTEAAANPLGGDPASAAQPAQPDPVAAPAGDAHALGQLFAELVSANVRGDTATAAAICRRVYPDGARIRAGLREDAPAAVVAKLEAFYAELRPQDGDDAGWAKLLATPPARTEVKVYEATTEQIAANGAEGVVAAEFHDQAPSVAQRLLRPGLTFHVVEVTEPNKDLGTKFHLFFWDGTDWCMLGPVWRAER